MFGLAGFDERNLDAMLGTYCPNVLYPYARQAIGDLIPPAASRRSCCSRSTSSAVRRSLRQRAAAGQRHGSRPSAGNA